jgi:hypothetical protein
MARDLKTVAQFAATSPFSESTLRWHIFNAESNGLAASGALVRVGRRVYLDVEGFEVWLERQNPHLSSPPPKSAKECVRELHSKGASTRQIEAETGISKSSVHRMVHESRSRLTPEHLESVQMHILNAMYDLRHGRYDAALKTLGAASVAVSQAIAAAAQQGGA